MEKDNCDCSFEENVNNLDDEQKQTCDCDEGADCGCLEGEPCSCGEDCNCEKECDCDCKSTEEKVCQCKCGDGECEHCKCDESCKCGEDCKCDNCECDDERCEHCKCDDACDCEHTCDKKCSHDESPSGEEIQDEQSIDYLKDFQRVQAEFDNYRKRMQSALGEARQDGFVDAIEKFLPALDSFKMATDMITDKNVLMGIKFIEKGILDTLTKMGVETIDATGKFNPELHHAIDSVTEEGYESGDIVKECYKGFTYNGKVIRYSHVVVQK